MTLFSRTAHQAHHLSPIWVLCCYTLLTGSPPAVLTPLLTDRVGMLLWPGGAEGLGHTQAKQGMFVWFPWLLHGLLH